MDVDVFEALFKIRGRSLYLENESRTCVFVRPSPESYDIYFHTKLGLLLLLCFFSVYVKERNLVCCCCYFLSVYVNERERVASI